MVLMILGLFFIIRLYSLSISIRHERELIAQGAVQCGAKNSKYLALLHILIYVASFVYATIAQPAFNVVSQIGLVLLIVSYMMLFWVIRTLGPIWTLKVYILKEHHIVKSGLFKFVKHPNYFLNIIPELIGVILLTQAYPVSVLLIPYAVSLYVRIQQEESAMAHLK
ncbi:hypothetical protein HMPREF3110_07520 [Staphylococcus sp. HMSC10C03]|uniref:isoprenylcysteine carboxyl methyltransferase family protein n=1 Tax=Staphylococcus sp. HMSC10C03 TaxID=1581078 RepID=UPI0008A63445|nr:isoprenylcysteine carboxyl methyltransferase family protein [Staphylococcus sp. HMSC10C03]OFU78298.1 hypothetical protein HMPREF3110_07520 [Staphylococcus sp. HMSC10C03]